MSSKRTSLAKGAFILQLLREIRERSKHCIDVAAGNLSDAAPEKGFQIFDDCFSGIAEEIAGLVDTYFPRLVKVAKSSTAPDIQKQDPIYWAANFFEGVILDFTWEYTHTPTVQRIWVATAL